jgi:hypothetical protein
MQKTWANANLNDVVNITTTGATNNVSFASVADTASETDVDATTYTVFAGETLTFTENFTTGTATNYTSAIACSGATDTDASDGLLIDVSDTAITCTYTNNAAPAPTLAKAFAPDPITVGGVSTLTITVTNPNAFDLTNAALTDTYPTEITNAATPNVVNSCGGTVTAAAGGGSVVLTCDQCRCHLGDTRDTHQHHRCVK